MSVTTEPTESTEPTEAPESAEASPSESESEPAQPPAPPPSPPPDAGGRRPSRRFLAGALAGAVAGALVAGSIALATNDDDSGSSTSAPSAGTNHSSATIQGLDVAAVLDQVQPAVVSVQTERLTLDNLLAPEVQEGAGTGFIVSADGNIVTNDHVVDGAQQVSATLADGTTKPAHVVGADATADLAVLKIDGHDLPTVTLGHSDQLHVGDPVVAIGNALALQGGPTVTEGIVSAMNRTISEENGVRLQHLVQTDAAINPGNSGGPLVDSQGRVVGINTAVAGQAQNIGFAISIDQANQVVNDLENGQTPAHPFLGVQAVDVTPALESQFGLAIDHGALVVTVESGSSAATAGIQQGDVILKFGSHDIQNAGDLADAVANTKPGDHVDMTLERRGHEQTLTVNIGERPASAR